MVHGVDCGAMHVRLVCAAIWSVLFPIDQGWPRIFLLESSKDLKTAIVARRLAAASSSHGSSIGE